MKRRVKKLFSPPQVCFTLYKQLLSLIIPLIWRNLIWCAPLFSVDILTQGAVKLHNLLVVTTLRKKKTQKNILHTNVYACMYVCMYVCVWVCARHVTNQSARYIVFVTPSLVMDQSVHFIFYWFAWQSRITHLDRVKYQFKFPSELLRTRTLWYSENF